MKDKFLKKSGGFTLIEILVAIAIVAILAAVVLVSMKSYAVRARSAKALASLSSAIPSVVSCMSNGGTLPSFAPGNSICYLSGSWSTNYGRWPAAAGDLSVYTTMAGSFTSSSSWWVSWTSGASQDDVKICCNSAMNGCKALTPASSTCNLTNPSY